MSLQQFSFVAIFSTLLIQTTAYLENYEKDTISDLNSVETIKILGDFLTIESKNDSLLQSDTTTLERYMEHHYVRVNLPEEPIDFDLKDLLPLENRFEGRGRLKKILLPLLLALKIGSAVIVPVAMSLIGLIAIKGLWSGLTALVISKVLALKSLAHKHHFSHQPKLSYELPHHVHEYWDRNEATNRPHVLYYPDNVLKQLDFNRGGEEAAYKPDSWSQWDDTQQEFLLGDSHRKIRQ